jgi:hypothetical protein
MYKKTKQKYECIDHVIIYDHAKDEMQRILVQPTTKNRKTFSAITGYNCSQQTCNPLPININFSFLLRTIFTN